MQSETHGLWCLLSLLLTSLLLSKISTKTNNKKAQHSTTMKSLDLEQILSFISADRIFFKFTLTSFNFMGHLCKMEIATCTIAEPNPSNCALPSVHCFYFWWLLQPCERNCLIFFFLNSSANKLKT